MERYRGKFGLSCEEIEGVINGIFTGFSVKPIELQPWPDREVNCEIYSRDGKDYFGNIFLNMKEKHIVANLESVFSEEVCAQVDMLISEYENPEHPESYEDFSNLEIIMKKSAERMERQFE